MAPRPRGPQRVCRGAGGQAGGGSGCAGCCSPVNSRHWTAIVNPRFTAPSLQSARHVTTSKSPCRRADAEKHGKRSQAVRPPAPLCHRCHTTRVSSPTGTRGADSERQDQDREASLCRLTAGGTAGEAPRVSPFSQNLGQRARRCRVPANSARGNAWAPRRDPEQSLTPPWPRGELDESTCGL